MLAARVRHLAPVVSLVGCLGIGAAAGPALAAQQQLPTTALDFLQPGTQPDPALRFSPAAGCASQGFCHGGFLPGADDEPYDAWAPSLMAQSARDPVWQAALAIANADAAGSGETCIRCHAPAGWLGGRSTPGTLEVLPASDFDGVNCHFCHRLVRPVLGPGSAVGGVDAPILQGLASAERPSACTSEPHAPCVSDAECAPPGVCREQPGQGRFVIDPGPHRRGPLEVGTADPELQVSPGQHRPGAETIESPFHRTSDVCASCHDVSTALYTRDLDGVYRLNGLDEPAPLDPHAMFPEQRTYSEWQHSAFGGACEDGAACLETSCQDCHMPERQTQACRSGPVRADASLHSLAGGNTWVVRAVRDRCRQELAGSEPASPTCAGFALETLLGTCAADRFIQCAADGECGTDGPCVGTCRVDPRCAADDECGDGGVCVKGPATRAHCAGDPEHACAADDECGAAAPCLGRCGDDGRCSAAADCAGGLGACVKSPATFARCAGDPLRACGGDDECGEAGPCLGRCVGAPDGECIADAECSTPGARCIKDPVRLAETRTEDLLRAAADLVLSQHGDVLSVRVVNQAGHKLPTGYPEGRRMWLGVRFLDDRDAVLEEHGAYDFVEKTLHHAGDGALPSDAKIYEARHTIDEAVAAATGLAAGSEYHLVLNNRVAKDNRIPPRGFRNEAYRRIGAAPTEAAYADGQHWDDTHYAIPAGAASAVVILYFETTTREYVEFLRDAAPAENLAPAEEAFGQWERHAWPVMMDARRITFAAAPPSTTSTSTLRPVTTTTLPSGCASDGECDDGDPCTVDRCGDGICSASVTTLDGVTCTLERLGNVECVGEVLPRALRKTIRKKAKAARRNVRQAAKAEAAGSAKKAKKARKLRQRAARQLDAITKRAARAAKAGAKKHISPACHGEIAAAVAAARALVTRVTI